jgi:organic radical activating enzyme
MRRYFVDAVCYAIQGVGLRIGCPSVFVRFADHIRGEGLTADQILQRITAVAEDCTWVVFMGVEPARQLDEDLILRVRAAGYDAAAETFGSVALSENLDWITVIPRVPELEIQQLTATEVIYVRDYEDPIPETVIKAENYLITPATTPEGIPQYVLRWCTNLVRNNPNWRLTLRQHFGGFDRWPELTKTNPGDM